jgi:hypothetical protein
MFSEKLKKKLENLAIGESVILTDEDDVRWVFSKNAKFGEEKKPWFQVTVVLDYDEEYNSGKTYNLDRKVETVESLFEVYNAPFMEQWLNVGGAVENPCFW